MVDFSFSNPPEDNIAYFLSKKRELHFNYDEIMFESHHKAFTVAKITRADLLQDIQSSLIEALKDGKSFSDWKKEIQPTLQKKGWWGKQEVIDGDTGEVKTFTVGSNRLRTIYDTNMRVAYAVSRANKQYRGDAEYLRYVAVMDERTRPEHAEMNGAIAHRDHPFWEFNYPPNGWNCRCRVDAYTEAMVKKRGWSIQEELPDIADKDWYYDTRNLQYNDDEISRVIKEKVKKINNTNDPKKIIRSYLEETLQDVKENRKLYKDVKSLYIKAVSYEKSLVISQIDSKVLLIAKTTDEIKKHLNTKADNVLLSGWTIRTHTHHKNIGAFDYYLLPHMLKNVYKYKKSRDNHILFFSKLGIFYKAVLKKATNKDNEEEVYLQSLIKSKYKL